MKVIMAMAMVMDLRIGVVISSVRTIIIGSSGIGVSIITIVVQVCSMVIIGINVASTMMNFLK